MVPHAGLERPGRIPALQVAGRPARRGERARRPGSDLL